MSKKITKDEFKLNIPIRLTDDLDKKDAYASLIYPRGDEDDPIQGIIRSTLKSGESAAARILREYTTKQPTLSAFVAMRFGKGIRFYLQTDAPDKVIVQHLLKPALNSCDPDNWRSALLLGGFVCDAEGKPTEEALNDLSIAVAELATSDADAISSKKHAILAILRQEGDEAKPSTKMSVALTAWSGAIRPRRADQQFHSFPGYEYVLHLLQPTPEPTIQNAWNRWWLQRLPPSVVPPDRLTNIPQQGDNPTETIEPPPTRRKVRPEQKKQQPSALGVVGLLDTSTTVPTAKSVKLYRQLSRLIAERGISVQQYADRFCAGNLQAAYQLPIVGVNTAKTFLDFTRQRVHDIHKNGPFVIGTKVDGQLLFSIDELVVFKLRPRPSGVHSSTATAQ